MQKACLVLSDGSIYEGFRFGAERDAVCEVVFSTGLTGYVELLTDASFCGQAVVMATPIIGNYGVFEDVSEARRLWVGALIVRDLTTVVGDHRKAEDLHSYLARNDVPGISGVDTRALTVKIREEGTKIGLITNGTKEQIDLSSVMEKIGTYNAKTLVPQVSPKEIAFYPAWKQGWDKAEYMERKQKGLVTALDRDEEPDPERPAKYKIALIDFGAKHNILWNLTRRGCEVTDYPWDTKADVILQAKPDGVFLSNGPGDPEDCESAIEQIRILIDSGIPLMGICLGHQLVALAAGAKTRKLKYGHRGANHPVKDIARDRVYITSQNHGYVVIEDSIPRETCEISHINVNDGTVEGLKYLNKPVFTVQYHPEGSPGPQDNNYLFDRFIKLIDDTREAGSRT